MYAVEVYAAVRRFVFNEGKSRREAARVFGLSRDGALAAMQAGFTAVNLLGIWRWLL